jgi:NADPH-dependent 2,4-dienoyl-CoA reductase/sulfur reductase-like enzyme
MNKIVVVGASLAGVSAAEELRSRGYEGELVLLGEEPHRPYTRPPLSKDALLQGIEASTLALRAEDWYAERGIDLKLGASAVALDNRTKQLRLADGSTVAFEGLVIATGLTHRPIPSHLDLPEAHQLRTVDEARRLASDLATATHLIVIGAGFIGLETAATARLLGLEVTVVDIACQPMSRAFGPEIGSWFARRHEAMDVRLVLSANIVRAEQTSGVTNLFLDTGEVLRGDACVVGTGSVPATDWLRGSGVAVGDGVLCDPTLATTMPNVVAAGDVARWENPQFGESMRVEHWTNAVEHGVHAAARLLGDLTPFSSVPFFWTDQFDAKLSCIGRPQSTDEVNVLVENGSQLVVAFARKEHISGAVCVNAPREMAALRRAIAERTPIAEILASSASTPAPISA